MFTPQFAKKTVEFLLYTASIYACYICTGIYHEKILKHQYIDPATNQAESFDAPIVFTLFPPLVCTLIGWAIRTGLQSYGHGQVVSLPWRRTALCSLIINVNMWTYNKAVQAASFPAVVMVKSCSMLSVIIVALFCSQVKDQSLKLPLNKLWVGVGVSLGIFLFNFFKDSQASSSNNRPISYLSSALLLISLLGDGILPDLQAQLKSTHKPGMLDLYFQINKYTSLISLLYILLTWQFPYIVTFLIDHPELQTDLVIFSILSAIGQLVIYRMIKLFKQHILPFVIATRKCITVVVNIRHFGHQINAKQVIGMAMVFGAILVEVVLNARDKKKQSQKAQLQLPEVDEETINTEQFRLDQPSSPKKEREDMLEKEILARDEERV